MPMESQCTWPQKPSPDYEHAPPPPEVFKEWAAEDMMAVDKAFRAAEQLPRDASTEHAYSTVRNQLASATNLLSAVRAYVLMQQFAEIEGMGGDPPQRTRRGHLALCCTGRRDES